MELDRNTMDGLIQEIDHTITRFDKNVEVIEREFSSTPNTDPHMQEKYKERMKRNESICINALQESYTKIKTLCERLKDRQPALQKLNENHINLQHGFPRSLVFGKYKVSFDRPGNEKSFYVPRMIAFPIQKPVRIDKRSELPFIHQLLLRLNFALPVDKQEYYFFDPRGLGSSVKKFNRLFTSEKLVPQQKIMMNTSELKDALKHVELYIRDLYTHTFNIGCGENWEEYNRYWYEKNERRKMLPYRVFVFMDVPLEMDQDCFRMFRNLLEHNGECGILVLFSCDEAIWTDSKDRIRSNIEQELLQVAVDKCIHPTDCFLPVECQCIQISSEDEELPSSDELREMLTAVCEAAKTDLGSIFSFSDMLSENRLFSCKSSRGIEFPIGYDTTGGSLINLSINDRTPHYLIGGTTGSGKSNLLHNLIVSACWNYSPDEVRVYLLDFKEGVEFNQYAMAAPYSLPHAALVATEADTEYGVTVLHHLDEELSRRAKIFKQESCKDICAYRVKNPNNLMPRIIAVIDEFQVLFDSEQKFKTLERMTRIAKQGRSAGVHLILATQSLKGLSDFSAIATQFSGRIALKCAAEDSKLLLGGIASNNEAASELEIPYAIVNTAQGNVAENIKIAIPEAKTEEIKQKLNRIYHKTEQQSAQYTPTKIFSGQIFPKFPEVSVFNAETICLTLGRTLSYEEDILRCKLLDKQEYNMLICGHDPQIKGSMLKEIIVSADYSSGCDEIAYIGDDEYSIVQDSTTQTPLQVFADAYAFAQYYENLWQEKRIIAVFDNQNLAKTVGFSTNSFSASMQRETDTAKLAMRQFWNEGNRMGSHFVAFFDSGSQVKASGMPMGDFIYRVAYAVNVDEMNLLLGQSYGKAPSNRQERAFLIKNQEITAVFRPFVS